MNISPQQQNLIDAYLRDGLTEEMKQNFESALATDEVFKKEFIFQQSLAEAADLESVKEAMEQAKVDNLLDNKPAHPEFKIVQNTLREAKAENIKDHWWQRIKKLSIGGLAAACVVLASFGGWAIHLKNDVERGINHADVSLSSDLGDIQHVSGNREVVKFKLEEAKKAYEAEDFDKVFSIFKRLREQYDYQPDELIYYETTMHARTGNYKESIKLLNELIQKKSHIEHDARWYAALVYLKTNEKIKAKEQFNVLVQHSEKYKSKARKKLQKHYFL